VPIVSSSRRSPMSKRRAALSARWP
jgi:hypothetical protein